MKRKLIIFMLCAFYSTLVFSQTKISGKIIDGKGQTIPGVTVKVVGTKIVAASDFEGGYAIETSGTSKLEFSFIGFVTQEIDAENRTVINITMEDEVSALDEVVVTAVGIRQQKKKLGYTTQQVTESVLQQANPINLATALSGQVAGLAITNPTGIFQAPDIKLRGKSHCL